MAALSWAKGLSDPIAEISDVNKEASVNRPIKVARVVLDDDR